MSAVLESEHYPTNPPGEERVVLHNVSWSTYEQLLGDLANQSAPRLTYDSGMLEIMSPGPLHEKLTHIIETMIERLAEEMSINVECLRSTTFRRKTFKRGFEPDSCFYIKNEATVRGKEHLNLRQDPAPDLVIEIDITGASIDKFPIFAQMQVPEVWVHDGNKLTIYTLQEQAYAESSNSLSFNQICSAHATEFIERTRKLPRIEFLKALRQWIKEVQAKA